MRNAPLLLIAALLTPLPAQFGQAWAMGTNNPAPPTAAAPADPDFAAGRAAIDRQQWAEAVALFSRVANKDPKNADALNYLGFAYRNQGNYPEAFKHYAAALQIDPRHKGALEYQGEAYIKTGNMAKAEENLAALDRICTFGCAEFTELKEKIAKAKAGKGS